MKILIRTFICVVSVIIIIITPNESKYLMTFLSFFVICIYILLIERLTSRYEYIEISNISQIQPV